MKKILLVDNFKIFNKWASKTYEYKLKSISKDNRFKVIDIDEIEKINLEDYEKLILGWNMCIYSKYYTSKWDFYKNKIENLENLSDIVEKTCKLLAFKNKYLILQDFINNDDYCDGMNSLTNYLQLFNFKGIITPYFSIPQVEILKNLNKKLEIIHLEHHIDENIFKDWKLEKKYDIFIFGNCNVIKYPLRNRILKILKNNTSKFNILFWDNLMSKNYFKFNPSISNENLSKKINESWLCVSTSSHAKVLLGKYIEIGLSGSVPLGDIPLDGEKYLKNNIIEIKENMSDDEILKKIEESLKEKDKLIEKVENLKKEMEKLKLSFISNKLYDLLI